MLVRNDIGIASLSGGVNVGFANQQVTLQIEAGIGVGPGLFAGAGGSAGGQRVALDASGNVAVGGGAYTFATANGGAGTAVGTTTTAGLGSSGLDGSGSLGVTRAGFLGAGAGVQASAGVGVNYMLATPDVVPDEYFGRFLSFLKENFGPGVGGS